MIDLTTHYLGLKLANPLVPSASPLSRDVATACRLEDAGAAALVIPVIASLNGTSLSGWIDCGKSLQPCLSG